MPRNSLVLALLMIVLTGLALAGVASAANPTGVWKSTITLNGQNVETKLVLNLDSEGPTLSGFELHSESNRRLALYDSSYKPDRILFFVKHESSGELVVIHYQGTIAGDTISGKATFQSGDRSQPATWVARRAAPVGGR